MSVRTLIVDDESLARTRVKTMLQMQPDVEVVGECADGRQALSAIRQMRPDLVFLDVQIPEMDAFQVLESLEPEKRPAVIFVTAYDKYALRAIDARCMDYLLKPFDQERFDRALQRARDQILQQRGAPASQRLVIRDGRRVLLIKAEQIEWVEAARNYLCLHVGGETHLLRETMSNFAAKLDAQKFVRIHRSYLVNLDYVKELQSIEGEYEVVMRDQKKLPISRSYRANVQQALQRSA